MWAGAYFILCVLCTKLAEGSNTTKFMKFFTREVSGLTVYKWFFFPDSFFTELSNPKQLWCVKVVKVLRLEGNPLCDKEGWQGAVRDEVTNLQELTGAANNTLQIN